MMIRNTAAKIFLAGQRGKDETPVYRSLHTLTGDTFHNEHTTAFGDLLRMDDELLAPGQQVEHMVKSDASLIVLPLSGTLECLLPDGNTTGIAGSQVLVIPLSAGEKYVMLNTSRLHNAGYLQLLIKRKAGTRESGPAMAGYNLTRFMNVLMRIAAMPDLGTVKGWHLSLGKFTANSETMYRTRNENAGLFVFVIEGLFEVEGRMLQARDGLAIWNTQETRTMALRQDAVLLTLECPFNFSHP